MNKVCNEDCLNCKFDDCIKGDTSYISEHRKEYYREYYKKNKEKYSAYNKAYREKHREELNAKAREYYRLHGNSRDRKEYAKAYYEAHKHEIMAKQKARLESDPEKAEKQRAYLREYMKTYRRKKKEV